MVGKYIYSHQVIYASGEECGMGRYSLGGRGGYDVPSRRRSMTESRSISVVDSAILIQNQTKRGGPGRGFSGRRSWRQRRATGGSTDAALVGAMDGDGRHLLVGEGDVGLTRWTLDGAEVVEVQRLPFLESHHKFSRKAVIESTNNHKVPWSLSAPDLYKSHSQSFILVWAIRATPT